MISIQNVSKTYPSNFPRLKKLLRLPIKESVEALQNVSFEVGEGEIFGLIGKNGAGKTTLTKIIATLVQPTSGKVSVNGFDSVKDEVKVRSLIGLATAEERSFYWRLSCEQNLLFFARLYGMNDREANLRILQLFEQLGLTELSKRKFSDLSTGNKQRLAVARALLANPPCLLLDEPTRSLDPIAAASMRELIASLKNVSILLTSHNLTEIEELCSRVAIISKGEIKAVGKSADLRRQHKQTQQVTITYNHDNNLQTQTFSREVDDDLLGKTISELTNKGAKIIDVETQKATLLDVLESYEK
jgi:ABC-2 type transport system ATP-binding protein